MTQIFHLDHSKTQAENKEMLQSSKIGDIAEGHYRWKKVGIDQWKQII